jgi:FAD synthase
MIVGRDDLADLRGTVTMVDGGFDPLHPGHIAYFERAAAASRRTAGSPPSTLRCSRRPSASL